MFVNVFAAASTAPIATLTYTRHGRKYSESLPDGGIVGYPKDGCKVCIVDQFPKLITPTGEAFLINGKKVSAGGLEYEVSGVKIHKLCYMVNPERNQSLRAALEEIQAKLQKEAGAYWKELERHIKYFRANRAPENGDPEYVHIMTELRKHCSCEFVAYELRKSETKKAIDTLERLFTAHAIVQGSGSYEVGSKRKSVFADSSAMSWKRRLFSVGSATYFAHSGAQDRGTCEQSLDKATEQHLAAVKFFEIYRKYMAVYETLNANRKMKQKPLFELLNKDITRTSTRKVYEGERFTVNCGSEELTAHSVRGVPVVKAADGSLQMVMEGGYLKVASGPGSAALYAHYDSDNEEPTIRVRRTALYYVSDVNTPMGITHICCDEDEFVKLSKDAHQSVIDRYSDNYKEWERHYTDTLVGFKKMVDEKRVNLNSSNLLPTAKKIMVYAHFLRSKNMQKEYHVTELVGLYDVLMRESNGSFSGDNSEAYFIAGAARGLNATVQALRRAEAHAARSATV